MNQPRPAVNDMTMAEDRRRTAYEDEATATEQHEAAYAGEATATGRRESPYTGETTPMAEYQDPTHVGDNFDAPARVGDGGADGLETHTDILDESGPNIARRQPSMAAEQEPTRAPSDGNLAPGQAHDPVAALWATDLVERYRTQWRDLQLEFVDDPKHAMDAAASLVDEAVASLTNNLNAQKQALGGWQANRGEDTEVMRVALRRYRDFLDRLLGL